MAPRDRERDREPGPGPGPGLAGMSDDDVMCAHQRGDERAFPLLFQRYGSRIYSYFVHTTSDRALAEDLLQQTFLTVHRARATFRPQARFAPWLYTIAANLRRTSIRTRVRSHIALTADGQLPEPPPAASPAAAAAAAEDRHEAVRQAVAALPESYRDVILLHRWHELGFAEIADVLGTTEGAVKVRAHRGYLQLREALARAGIA
jgi:RNA polymerase sigma-70 factor (ECF subfamily)